MRHQHEPFTGLSRCCLINCSTQPSYLLLFLIAATNCYCPLRRPTAVTPVVISPSHFQRVLQRLEQQGELVEQHFDPMEHALARRHHGVSKASIAAAVAEGKIPVVLTDVEAVQKAQAGRLDCLSIFLAPSSPEVCITSCCLYIWLSELPNMPQSLSKVHHTPSAHTTPRLPSIARPLLHWQQRQHMLQGEVAVLSCV